MNNHFEDNILRIEKLDAGKPWTLALRDADQQGFAYLKRFTMADATVRHQTIMGENPNSQMLLLTDTPYPNLLVTLGGSDAFRGDMQIDAESFIAVKGFKAKGKRITTFVVERVSELVPLRQPEPEQPEQTEAESETSENLDPDEGKTQDQVADEMTGQLRLFDE